MMGRHKNVVRNYPSYRAVGFWKQIKRLRDTSRVDLGRPRSLYSESLVECKFNMHKQSKNAVITLDSPDNRNGTEREK